MNNDIKIIKTEVLIIGGGAGGCGTALEYAKSLVNLEKPYQANTSLNLQDHDINKILLVDEKELMSATSSIHPGRAGLGFHYKHLPTAIMLLKVTLNLMLEHHPPMIGGDLPYTHPIKRGRYFITKDSQEEPKTILETYEKLRDVYCEFARENPEILKIFGEPKDFFRVLDPHEYQDEVDINQVAVGIETAEQLLDVPKFINYIKEQIKKYEIKVFEHCKIVNISYDPNGKGFIVTTENGFKIHASLVVNATWQDIEYINKDLNFIKQKDYRTNRLKALAEAKIPPSIRNYSKFFCFGAHCMYSYIDNDKGLMTYALKTNVESSTDLETSKTMKIYLAGQLDDKTKNSIGKEIIEGVSTYIPAMKDAELLGVRFGIIKTYGTVDIFSHDSKFHERDYSGIEEEQVGYINNACMKFLYIFENGKIASALIKKHLKLQKNLNDEIDKQIAVISQTNSTYNTKILRSALRIMSERYFDVNNIEIINDKSKNQPFLSTEIIKNKKKINQELLIFAANPKFSQNKSSLFNKKPVKNYDRSYILSTKYALKRI